MNEYSLYNVETGEIHSANISLPELKVKYYNGKRLNVKIWIEGLSFYRHKVCVSMLESKMFDYISYNLDRHNEFREVLVNVAKLHDTTQPTISRLIKKMVDANVLERLERGVYRFNPFLIKSKGCTNKDIVALQTEWESKYGIIEVN